MFEEFFQSWERTFQEVNNAAIISDTDSSCITITSVNDTHINIENQLGIWQQIKRFSYSDIGVPPEAPILRDSPEPLRATLIYVIPTRQNSLLGFPGINDQCGSRLPYFPPKILRRINPSNLKKTKTTRTTKPEEKGA